MTPDPLLKLNSLSESARHRATLEKIRAGLATRVRILANDDCCPLCSQFEGSHPFEDVPELPHEGCSHPRGCRCHYEPVLDMFGP